MTINILNLFFRQLPVEKRVSPIQIDKHDIRKYAERLSQRNLKACTINTTLKILRGFFAYLVDEDLLLKNPVLYRYHVEEERRLPRPMKQEDLRIFLVHLKKPFDRAMYLLMLRCGLRAGEASRLELSDIDWQRKNFIVRNGKGKVDRVVYISEDVLQALKIWLGTLDGSSKYCFPAPRKKDDKPISMRWVHQRMKDLLGECGLEDKGYSPHTLRHTFATSMLNSGVALHVLRDLMGHKRLDQTLMYAQLYDHTVRDSYFRAMKQLENKRSALKEVASGLS